MEGEAPGRRGEAPEIVVERVAGGAAESGRPKDVCGGVPVGAEVRDERAQAVQGKGAGPPPVPELRQDGVLGGQTGHMPHVGPLAQEALWSRLGRLRGT